MRSIDLVEVGCATATAQLAAPDSKKSLRFILIGPLRNVYGGVPSMQIETFAATQEKQTLGKLLHKSRYFQTSMQTAPEEQRVYSQKKSVATRSAERQVLNA